MSKRVQLKFKKLLKKAEFVHADLEYHEELLPEAKKEFFEEAGDIFNSLPEEERSKMNDFKHKQEKFLRGNIKEDPGADTDQDPELQRDVCASEETPINEKLDLETTEAADSIGPAEDTKTSEIKKLFHKIAGIAHPDKAGRSGLASHEISRLEELFKKAADAHNNSNWYTLYSIATSLGIEIDNISDEHTNWLEDDIRSTMRMISRIGNLIVWAWYVGDEKTKRYALKNYFKQTYDYSL